MTTSWHQQVGRHGWQEGLDFDRTEKGPVLSLAWYHGRVKMARIYLSNFVWAAARRYWVETIGFTGFLLTSIIPLHCLPSLPPSRLSFLFSLRNVEVVVVFLFKPAKSTNGSLLRNVSVESFALLKWHKIFLRPRSNKNILLHSIKTVHRLSCASQDTQQSKSQWDWVDKTLWSCGVLRCQTIIIIIFCLFSESWFVVKMWSKVNNVQGAAYWV